MGSPGRDEYHSLRSSGNSIISKLLKKQSDEILKILTKIQELWILNRKKNLSGMTPQN